MRYQDNIFVKRLWRTVKYKEMYLKAYVSVLDSQRGLESCPRFYSLLRPHPVLGFRAPSEGLRGEHGVV